MGRSQQSFEKREREKKRQKKQQQKREKMEARRAAKEEGGGDTDMFAYVDEFGNITDTPPDPAKKKEEVKLEDIQLGAAKREKVVLDAVREGKVDFFNYEKGYGFIKESGTGESYFVHINGCLEEIDEGNKVEFELERGQKGMNAVKVKKIVDKPKKAKEEEITEEEESPKNEDKGSV